MLRNDELCGIYRIPDIVKIVKSWRLVWTEHVPRVGR